LFLDDSSKEGQRRRGGDYIPIRNLPRQLGVLGGRVGEIGGRGRWGGKKGELARAKRLEEKLRL
jgi:hypothetical protein